MAEVETGLSPDMEKRRQQRLKRAQKAKPRRPEKFSYAIPEGERGGKAIVHLAQTDLMRGSVQVVKPGEGDNNLHTHTGMDGFWLVLKGRVRFYGPGDEVLGEFGPHEGIMMPRNNAYWFAAIGDEDLEILQVSAYDRDVKNERVNLEPEKWQVGSTKWHNAKVD